MNKSDTRQIFLVQKIAKNIEDYLCHVENLSPRSKLKLLFKQKKIFINNHVAVRTSLIKLNDLIRIESNLVYPSPQNQNSFQIIPNEKIKIQILAQTRDWICINKQAGLHCHPHHPSENQTVLNGLATIDLDCAREMGLKKFEGGLIHRLDQGTSGILLCAKNVSSYKLFRNDFKNRVFEKVYCAWVTGNFRSSVFVKLWLCHHAKNNSKMSAFDTKPKQKSWEAITEIKPIFKSKDKTLCLIRIHTGVTHQIRATMAALGHPIFGDLLYKSAKPLKHLNPSTPLEKKTSETLSGLSNIILSEIKDKNPNPQIESLPRNGFFLHAFFLKNKLRPSLKHGIIAKIPNYFWGNL